MRGTSYVYRAARTDGVLESGVFEAESRDEVSTALAERGLFPIEIKLDETYISTGARTPLAELALGLRVLATLIESGLSMSRALSAFEELAPTSWRPALPALRDAVREGQSLATALARAPIEVPPVVIGIIQAGEAGSGTGAAVRRAAELMESTAATRAAIRGALAYPLILAGAGVASIALLVGLVLPRFAAILADLGQMLPPTTRIILGVATVARTAAIPALIVLFISAIIWRSWVRTESGRASWHQLLLSFPLIGTVRRSSATARTCSALAALLESGVPISQALLRAARAAGDAAIERRLLAARESIVIGERVAGALSSSNAMTTTAVRLVRAGEETGRLAPMLTHAAILERERAEQLTKSAVRALEPTMIIVFGGLVAVVAAALLQAIYSVRPTP